MGDRHPHPHPHPHPQNQRSSRPSNLGTTFLKRFHEQAPNSTHLIGILTLAVSASILLLLSGLTVTAGVAGLVIFMPLIVLSSPIWVPLATVLFLATAALLSVFGFGVAIVGATSWLYRYVKGFNPPGAHRVDYARTRLYHTATHVKDCAKEYGGYLQGKVKDAAPGA